MRMRVCTYVAFLSFFLHLLLSILSSRILHYCYCGLYRLVSMIISWVSNWDTLNFKGANAPKFASPSMGSICSSTCSSTSSTTTSCNCCSGWYLCSIIPWGTLSLHSLSCNSKSVKLLKTERQTAHSKPLLETTTRRRKHVNIHISYSKTFHCPLTLVARRPTLDFVWL